MSQWVWRIDIGTGRLTVRLGAWPMLLWWPGFRRRLEPLAAAPAIIRRSPWKLDDEALF